MKGHKLEITEQEYFELENVIHSTKLARVYAGSNDLIDKKIVVSNAMAMGHALEYLIEDEVTGSKKFRGKYFTAKTGAKIPEMLSEWILNPEIELKKAIEETGKKRLTLKNETNKVNAGFFAWTDAALENPGMLPMDYETLKILRLQVESVLKIRMHGTTFGNVLTKAQFQVPYQFDNRVILADAILEREAANTVYIWDIKRIYNLAAINQRVNNRWWIQYCHYRDVLLNSCMGSDVVGVEFIASSCSESDQYYACRVKIEETDAMWQRYEALVSEYEAWVEGGKKKLGYAAPIVKKPWIRTNYGNTIYC